MITPKRFCLYLAPLVLALLLLPLAAQDKEITTKGQVKVGVHKYRMETGKLYQVRVDADGFTPSVALNPGYFENTERLNQGDGFQGYFVPTETREYRVIVSPSIDEDLDAQLMDYKITVTPIKLSEKLLLDEKGKLTAADPAYAHPDARENKAHKAYAVQLKARQTYIITMASEDREMDPYLYLEGPNGKIVDSDDDSGGRNNARIFIQPRRSGEYRIIATISSENLGDFTLTVRSTETPEK